MTPCKMAKFCTVTHIRLPLTRRNLQFNLLNWRIKLKTQCLQRLNVIKINNSINILKNMKFRWEIKFIFKKIDELFLFYIQTVRAVFRNWQHCSLCSPTLRIPPRQSRTRSKTPFYIWRSIPWQFTRSNKP